MEEKDIISARTKLMWISSALLIISIGGGNIKDLNLLGMINVNGVEFYGLRYGLILLAISFYLLMRYEQFLNEGKKTWEYGFSFLIKYLQDSIEGRIKIVRAELHTNGYGNQGKRVRGGQAIIGHETAEMIIIKFLDKSGGMSVTIDKTSVQCVENGKWGGGMRATFKGRGNSVAPDQQDWGIGEIIFIWDSKWESIKHVFRKIAYQYSNKTIWDQDFPIYLNKASLALFIISMIYHQLSI